MLLSENVHALKGATGQTIKFLCNNPSENSFGFLWLVNCIVYLVVVAFLTQKGGVTRVTRMTRVNRVTRVTWVTLVTWVTWVTRVTRVTLVTRVT